MDLFIGVENAKGKIFPTLGTAPMNLDAIYRDRNCNTEIPEGDIAVYELTKRWTDEKHTLGSFGHPKIAFAKILFTIPCYIMEKMAEFLHGTLSENEECRLNTAVAKGLLPTVPDGLSVEEAICFVIEKTSWETVMDVISTPQWRTDDSVYLDESTNEDMYTVEQFNYRTFTVFHENGESEFVWGKQLRQLFADARVTNASLAICGKTLDSLRIGVRFSAD